METLLQDGRYGARMLAKNPDFTAIAILTLALGIGASTAMFTVVNAVLLEPLHYKDVDRLMVLTEKDEKRNQLRFTTVGGCAEQPRAEGNGVADHVGCGRLVYVAAACTASGELLRRHHVRVRPPGPRLDLLHPAEML